MREKPGISDQAILSALREYYGLQVRELSFLPIGNDTSSYVYRVTPASGPPTFLKVKPGEVHRSSLEVPRFLRDQGISQVVAPLSTRAGGLSVPAGPFSLILYPFIEGPTGMDQGLTPAQWTEFGATLRQIHAVHMPPGLADTVRRENYLPVWGGQDQEYTAIERLYQALRTGPLAKPSERELAGFWAKKEAEIRRTVNRCAQLAKILREHPLEFVLCHTDIHTANLLIDGQGRLWIIDWDDPRLAPREHDLSFIGGSLAGRPQANPEELFFLQGYGQVQINPLAMTFYSYSWAVQEIGDYATRVIASPGLSEETKSESVHEFKRLFKPGNILPAAFQVDRDLLGARRPQGDLA